ncbi:hypothetical protein [Occallatibacter savannae]|uniref:Abi-alpha family protein n=1 Tax=Occallatibacter savannae TaxID=1002691 RepID=UPI000D691020|nr:hypothetical protein [Occallatibacter savannae]
MIATQMEATFCRAYNASKAHRLGLRITVADCAGEPFKLMKVILDGLAQNPEAAFWLTNVQYTPQIVRIFPLDFAYLDPELNVLEAVELPPGVPLPKFHPEATSALILPLGYLAANKTAGGDQLMIYPEDEFELRLADTPTPSASEVSVSEEPEADEAPHDSAAEVSSARQSEPVPFFTPRSTLPVQAPAVGSGSGFTLAIASTWQVATATTAAMPPVKEDFGADHATEVASPEDRNEDGTASTEANAALTIVEEPLPQPSTIDLTHIAALERALAKTEPPSESAFDEAISIPELEPEKPVLRATEELIARSKEAAEKAYVRVAPHAPAPPAKSRRKPGNQQQRKEHLGNKVVRWLALDEPPPERRKIIRLLLQGLQAYETNGDSSKRYKVRDICPPGLYIQTDEPWDQGDTLSLVLVNEGASDRDSEHRVRIQARVVRRDEEGVAVAFVFPEGTEFQPWQRAKTKRSDETEADFILRELRLARALGFLRRLCPWSANEVNHALLERLSNKRVASAVEIALQAEDILFRRGHVAQPFVASEVIVRIIEGGSWIDEDWIRRMWAGLLVSSCSADGQDRSNLPFIDLLARLTPIHLRILSYVCRRAVEAIAAGESEAALDLHSTAEELMEAADSHSFSRIQQTIGQLASVGLLAETARPSYVVMSDRSKTRTTPTALGLKMFARCNGQQS